MAEILLFFLSFPPSPQTPVIHGIAAQYCDIADLNAPSAQILKILLSPQLIEEIVLNPPTIALLCNHYERKFVFEFEFEFVFVFVFD